MPTETEPSISRILDAAPGRAAAVIGLQWGDEGKGKIIDLLAGRFDVVARFNGGANAGHSVVIDGVKHALHLVPSGIFHEGTRAVIGNGVVVDPWSLVGELDGLRSKGVAVESLLVSDRAHCVMPYHKQEDAMRETILAGPAGGSGDKSIGTTKRGIGPAYADKVQRGSAIRIGDLLHESRLRDRLRQICHFRNTTFAALDDAYEPIDADALCDDALAISEKLRPFIGDSVYALHDAVDDGQRILFEGANATLLDIDHGTFPFVTSSSTTALGIPAGSGIPGSRLGDVLGVVKAYSTRVGSGPFPTELDDEVGDRIRTQGNEFGTTTGRPRRCGWLDLVAVRYAAKLNGANGLAIMLLDVLTGFDTLRVCTSYEIDGEIVDRFPPDADLLARATPRYEEHPGWQQDLRGARRLEDLPSAARAYLDAIERFTGVPVRVVSVGPDRNDTVLLDASGA